MTKILDIVKIFTECTRILKAYIITLSSEPQDNVLQGIIMWIALAIIITYSGGCKWITQNYNSSVKYPSYLRKSVWKLVK